MESPFLSLIEFIIGIMPGVQPPHWDLAPTALAPGEGVWVFLKDTDAILPVLAVEVQAQAIKRAKGPLTTRKGAGAPLC